MSTEETTPGEFRSSEGLGLAPERAGQPRFMTIIEAEQNEQSGHWYSPAAVHEMLATERERCEKLEADFAAMRQLVINGGVEAAKRDAEIERLRDNLSATHHAFTLELQQHNRSHAEVLRLAERLRKYEPGKPMRLA